MLFCLFTSSSIAVGPRIDALRPLEELFPGILAARKASTVKDIIHIFKSGRHGLPLFPELRFSCFSTSFSLYLISLVQSGYSFASINSAFYSVNFFHNSCDVPNPCNSSFVKAILEGCKRVSANSV